ncbi:hypothetical protein ACJMK2_012782 [Sinanodonta woodiana]|uniref:THAP-type domain-containing protein n=1 Tax=Sinanodonta woodiana TaxID=1069815 RepID=A0ABD3V9B1_SINWO
MVNTCWVKDCTNRAGGSVKRSFYTIPVVRKFEGEQTKTLSEERRRTWLANINRKDLPSSYSKICSDHFIQGRPADLYNRSHPDWAPTLKLGTLSDPLKTKKKIKAVKTDMERYKRMQHRRKTREEHDIAKTLLGLQHFHETSVAQEGKKATESVNPVCSLTVKGKKEPDQEPTPKTNSVSWSEVDSETQHQILGNTQLKDRSSSYKMTQCVLLNKQDI